MSVVTFNPVTYDSLTFTNISVTESDVGSDASFTNNSGLLSALDTSNGTTLFWTAVNAGTYGANSSEVLNFNYNVSAASGSVIDSVGQIYTDDAFNGPGVH